MGAVARLVAVLAHAARGDHPVGDAEVEDLDRRRRARDRAQPRAHALARHQRPELGPDLVRVGAGARTADQRRASGGPGSPGRSCRRAGGLSAGGARSAGARALVARRARPRADPDDEGGGGEAGTPQDPFTHGATISERG